MKKDTRRGWKNKCRHHEDFISKYERVGGQCKEAQTVQINIHRIMWSELLQKKRNSLADEWCVGGDFNAILTNRERKGTMSHNRNQEMEEFAEFIKDMELIDVPVLGKKFTWFSSDGKSKSRLDRFLITEGIIEEWGVTSQWVGDRDISDHCPIWLDCRVENWGPKPFRFNNCWLDDNRFSPFVKECWNSFDVNGKKAYVIKEKMKLLKEKLRVWNKEVFGWVDLSIDNTVKGLNELDSMVGEGAVPDIQQRKELQSQFWQQVRHKESLIRQKSRHKWILEGDANTRFFHASLQQRRRKNQLVSFKKGDTWVEGVENVKKEVKIHFSYLFAEKEFNRPVLSGVPFKSISEEDNEFLLTPFSEEEIKEVIWNSDGNKSPGPDGFNFNFIKKEWDLLKQDVSSFVSEFHQNAILPKGITTSFLALIPKNNHPQTLSEYRPICLISSLYKILSKILAARLKQVLGKVISPCQTAFIPGRQILDGVVVLNELIDLIKKRRDKCMFLKVDFEKAFDSVSWKYLEYMLNWMGFHEKWIKWMRACVFSSSMSVLVNGSPTEDFEVSKGLRQGDPLSPFLFIIAAEGLTGLVNNAIRSGCFKGYMVSNVQQHHILQYADDTILLGEGSWENLWSLKSILRGFELVSGLKVNFYKSKLYGINVEDQFLNAASTFLSCNVDKFPFRFLGLPVGANPRRCDTWKPVVDAMKKKLSSWNGRNLSMGGRVTLINSVLSSLPLYYFAFFKAPKKILNELIKIQRMFLWGGCSE